MGKKKHNAGGEPTSEVDLKSRIHQHTLFFDKLIDLIPAKFYLPNDDKDKVWFHGLNKEEQALAKQKTRENIKKSRVLRMDPENALATTRDLLMQNLKKESAGDDNEDEDVETNPVLPGLEDDSQSVTYEELRQRLHRKIEELRAQRGGSDNSSMKNMRIKERVQQKKRKREPESEDKKSPTGFSVESIDENVEEATRELKFSHVKLGNDEDHGKKKRKLTKLQKLEKAKALEEAKKDPEKGSTIEEKHSWKAATNRAAGFKISSVEGLTKKIKKEKKKHEKSVKEWKDRAESQQKVKTEKQQKRSQNITEKRNQKKMKRIEKREKKLMRPGFEGRKADYINGDDSRGTGSL